MECVGCDRRPFVADWYASGNLIGFDSDLTEPVLILVSDEPPLAMLPTGCSAECMERMIAWCICELARERLGWLAFRDRIACYGRMIAS